MFENIISFQARYRPEAIALALPRSEVSFGLFDADVNRLARRLQPLTAASMRVAVQVTSPGLHWVALLALARLGCVSASLPRVGERPEADLLALLRPDLLLTDRSDAPASALHLSPSWIQETFEGPAESVESHRFEPDDPVRLVLSSGTTGTPKKMLITRRMVDERIRTGGLSQFAHRRLHSAVGLDTETGFRAPFVAWATGSPVLYPDAGFRWSDFLLGSRPQAIVLVPAQLDAILASLPQDFAPQPNLNLILVSGAPPSALYQRARTRLTPNIFVTYGSTEAGLACQASPWLMERGEALTGIISPSAEVEVVDDRDRALPLGAAGRVRVRTDEMVDGYLDDEALTRTYFKDGWFYPGDLGAISAGGRLSVHGRETEVLDLGGLRIAPSAIEEVLLACPGVHDAAAFAVSDGDGMQQARAGVVCTPACDLGAASAALRRALPQFEVELVTMAAIPRSERGKIQRDVLCNELRSWPVA